MKILLLGWNRRKMINWNFELFRTELARQHEVVFFGSGYAGHDPSLNVSEVLKQNPGIDFILVHIEHRDNKLAPGLEDIKSVLKVHICGDYFEYKQSVIQSYNIHFRKINYDIIFARDSMEFENLKNHSIGGKHYISLHTVDTNRFRKLGIEKIFDVMAALRTHLSAHSCRHELGRRIAKMDINSFLLIAKFNEYIKKINQSKIFVSSDVKYGFFTNKYSEVLACGTFMLTTQPNDGDLILSGLKDGEHLIFYKNDFSDLEDKINYFLRHEKEREEIAVNGMEFVRKTHSAEIRVKELIQIVEKELRKSGK